MRVVELKCRHYACCPKICPVFLLLVRDRIGNGEVSSLNVLIVVLWLCMVFVCRAMQRLLSCRLVQNVDSLQLGDSVIGL
jgi:hypothetical protein